MSSKRPHDLQSSDLDAAMRRLIDEELTAMARAEVGSTPVEPAAEQSAPAMTQWRAEIAALASRVLKIPAERLDARENMSRYGVDSIIVTEIMKSVSDRLDAPIAPTVFFEAKHLEELADILFKRFRPQIERAYAPAPAPDDADAVSDDPSADADIEPEIAGWLTRYREFAASLAQDEPATKGKPGFEPVAIIAMDGVFPQSPDLAAFEAHLAAGDDCISEVPPERWDWREVYGDPKQGEFTNVRFGGFAPDIDKFDPLFFGISPREAEMMDPQHRLFMQCVWRLIEGAGYAPRSLAGGKVGLFIGVNLQDYAHLIDRSDEIEALHLTSLGHMFCPNRLSFLLDVHGPSQVIDTACSSSLVALHRAVLAVQHEGCDMAVAGGANLMITPDMHIMYSKVGIICEDGRCKTFSPEANGYVRADGVGAVLVKTLARAEADGDPILAVIRGSAENHGGMATSLTAPNPKAQANLIVEAHRRAGVDPRSVGYIECHGTGTALGDPIEINGLKLAFEELYQEAGLSPADRPHCGLGSVKSNIGHAESAAGIAGVIKAVLSLQRARLYRTLHCDTINPLIDLAGSPFFILQQDRDWRRATIDGRETPRRAGVSSFGAGGSNAHVLIEEYVAPVQTQAATDPALIVLSARTKEQLATICVDLLRHVARGATASLAQIAYTLQVGRDAHAERLAFVASSLDDLRAQLARFVRGDALEMCWSGRVARRRETSQIDAATSALARRDLQSLAALWVAGSDVDWRKLYAFPPKRVTLPTYPFARQRCWLAQTGGDRRHAARKLHPLLSENSSRLDAMRFTTRFSGGEFFLADHVAMGENVLPGAAYLEMARAAVALAHDGASPVCLRNVVWARPYVAGAKPQPLHIELRAQDDRVGFRIYSDGDSGDVLHGQGAAILGAVEPAPRADLAALRKSMAHEIDGDACYRTLAAMGMNYGPAHRGLRSVFYSGQDMPRQALACIELPETLTAAAKDYVLHPALIDAALQACIGLAAAALHPRPLSDAREGAASLPFALDKLTLFAPPPHRLWVHVRPASGSSARLDKIDLDLIDEGGVVCLRLNGFSSRTPEPKAVAARDEAAALLLCRPVWREIAAIAAPVPWPQRHVVICDWEQAFPATLEAEIERQSPGVRCTRLALAAPMEQAYAQAVGAVFDAVRETSGRSLVQALVPAGGDGDMLMGLAGLLQTTRRENSQAFGQVIACDRGASAQDLADRLARSAVRPEDAQLRWNGAICEALRWDELPAPAPSAAPWKDNGVYLITGGAGGLGRLFARDIARKTSRATVILCGRSAADEVTLTELRALGLIVDYRAADVSLKADVDALVAEIVARYGRINGVLHAAGLLRDNFLRNKSRREIVAVLAPKVAGAMHLDRATAALDLDLFLVFASAAGAWGSAGQGDYAAANAFLDAFAHARNARVGKGERSGRTLAIDWPLWADGGMRMEVNALALMTQTTGMEPLPETQGLAAFGAILASDETQVMPLYGAPDKLRQLLASRETSRAENPVPVTSAPQIMPVDGLAEKLTQALTQFVATLMKFDLADVEADGEWNDYSFDSISLTDFANRLNQRYALDLTPTVFFEHPTIAALADWLAQEHAAACARALGLDARSASVAARVAPQAAPPPAPALALTEPPRSKADDGVIAIVGVSAAFPMAKDADEFWRNLVSGKDCIGEIPPDRWDWRAIDGDGGDRTRIRWGGFIDGVGDFDASFFGVSPREAATMDPAQRLLLEHVWRVIEDSGHSAASLSGSSTGVFIGTAPSGYGELMAQTEAAFDSHGSTGAVGSIGPNRVSFFLNLRGPSEPIETACSSALVALHRGVVAIQAGDCEQAIVGGVNLILRKETQISFDKAGMLSPDGRCKTFSKEANGYARAEGVGLLFLKTLSAAERDHDHIYALIRGSSVNHGGRSKSLTAPNPRAQAELIETTWRRAGLDPRSASYIETHGSGTALGDPIEIAGLTSAFAALYRDAGAPKPNAAHCALASVKSNIGHAELAAGVAGVVKTLWQFKHKTLVASLHCQDINPHIRLEGTPFHILRDNRPWTTSLDAQGRDAPRRAGVSSFGFGGVNAHVVLEEYPQPEPTPDHGEPQIIVLSAKSEATLKETARNLLAFIGASSAPDASPSQLATRLQAILAECLGVATHDVAETTPFDELGVEPIHRVMLRARLEQDLAREFDANPFQRETTLSALAQALTTRHPDLAGPSAPATRALSLSDLAFTLQVGRDAMAVRVGLIAHTLEEAAEKLSAFVADGAQAAGLHVGSVKPNKTLANLFTDDAFQSALGVWIAQGRFDRLLEIWSQGVDIDWTRLYGAGKPMPRRIPLPGYAFARKRFWLAANASRPSANVDAPPLRMTPAVLHPLLHEDISTPQHAGFRTRLTGREFFLADHKVQGRSVLPGVAYLEMARAAAQRILTKGDGKIVHISDVVWLRPALIDADAVLAIDFTSQADGGLRYRVTSEERANLHSEGLVSLAPADAPPRLDIAALISRIGGQSVAAADCYASFAAVGLSYGPAHRPITALHAGDGRVIARLDLPNCVGATLPEFVLHPSLMDGALQACVALADAGGGGLALPFALGMVDVFRPCTTSMWAYVRPAAGNVASARIRKIDIDLADSDGNVCVAIRGFATRAMERSAIAAPTTAPVDAANLTTWMTEYFRALLADTLKFDPADIDPGAALESFGIDSMLIVELTSTLEQKFGPVSKTLFFEHDTLAELVDHFVETHRAGIAALVAAAVKEATPAKAAPSMPAVTAQPATMQTPCAAISAGQPLDVAIIGLSGRYPMAHDVEEFWRNLQQGRDCITEIPIERWDWRAFYSDDSSRPGRHSCKWGGFVPDADKFDPLFFNISPSAAEYMDPQERIFLEQAFAALEDAGYRRDDLQQRADDDDLPAQVGVYAGVMYGEYQFIAREASLAGRGFTTANFYASIANRVSYALNLHGPSLSVDTMCSSSLTAIHLACQDLTLGRTEMALAGGVNLNLHPNKYEVLSTGQFISNQGRCQSFGAGGDGYVPSEGVGVIVLKRLADAERDGDHIYGVIKGSALNHGGRTNGYSVPNPNAQQTAISRAMREAHIDPRQLGYIEAHGTGTSLGDPIEIAGLAKALGPQAAPGQFWWIGSCKSNIGHCEGAAGMAGLTKVLLQMREGKIAPSIHADALNPNIDFDRAPFRVNTTLRDWPRPVVEGRIAPRLASVSSFGAGGSNAHLVVEEYVASSPRPEADPQGPFVFPLSARTKEQLQQRAEDLVAALAHARDDSARWLRDIAFTLQTGREAMPQRLAATAASVDELSAKLRRFLAGDTQGLHIGRAATRATQLVEPAGLKPEELAARFISGDELNWRAFYRDGDMPTRCSLPTYPFARERYWIDHETPAPVSVALASPVNNAEPDSELLTLTPVWRSAPVHPSRAEIFDERLLISPVSLSGATGVSVMELVSTQSDIAGMYTAYAEQMLGLLRRVLEGKPKARVLLQLLTAPGPTCPPDIVAGLGAMLKTAQQENPLLVAQVIEADSAAPAELARLAAAEARSSDAHIRYRDGKREALQWDAAPLSATPRPVWKEGGVYLITGGAGGLGLIVARHIAQRVKGARLILTGRSARPTGLAATATFAATVDYRSVDVADRAAVRALVDSVLREHGALNGVIHSAGVLRDGYILKKTAADLRDVFAAKVAGLVHLDEATRALDLDFFALFASLSGVSGNAGQADYAAANAFMDAYAHHGNAQAQRRRFLSLDWPLWAEGGMDIDPQAKDMMWRATGLRPLATEAGLRAFDDALASEMGQVLVLQGDGARLRRMASAEAPRMSEAAAPTASQPHAARASAERLVMSAVSMLLKLPEHRIEGDVPLEQYGIDSVMMMKLTADLEQHVGSLSKTLLFEYPTVDALSAHLAETRAGAFAQPSVLTDSPTEECPEPPVAAPSPTVPVASKPAEVASHDIAIIGMSGRFPGARNLDEFWELLATGGDAITEVPRERWDHAEFFDAARGKPGKTYCKWGGFIDGVDRFDARFFRIQPAEADLLDPQERLFLETVWDLLETSGCMGERLAQQVKSEVGVYVGSMSQQYHAIRSDLSREALVALSSPSSIANRVSYFFNFQGPSLAVDTMCSSALVALHMACDGLLRGDCRMAIAGGVNVTIHPKKYVALSLSEVVASHPDSRSFADGDGYLPAEGVGAVLLKPLASAIADGDEILGVIKSTAINHSGGSSGYRSPSPSAQADLIARNFERSGIDPRSVSYVESSSNGSPLGDAIEVRAQVEGFRRFTDDNAFCAIGAVKSNIGHAEAASGMSQLIKVLLQLKHGQIAPTIRTERLNPNISFEGTPFALQRELAYWRRPVITRDGAPQETPRRATVSALGLGGSSAHVIIEEYAGRAAVDVPPSGGDHLILLSAKTPGLLAERARQLRAFVAHAPDLSLDALAYTLQVGRDAMDKRMAFIARDRESVLAALSAALGEGASDLLVRSPGEDETAPARSKVDDVEIARLMAERDLDRLAHLWVNGARISWARLWGAKSPRCLALPSYPFERERFWLDPVVAEEPPAQPRQGFTPDLSRPAHDNVRRYLAQFGDVKKSFQDLGLDSIGANVMRRDFERLFGLSLSARDLVLHPTPEALADYAATLTRMDAPNEKHDAPAAGDAPLTQAQSAVYALHQYQPKTSAYNVPLALSLDESVSADVFAKACRSLLRRFPELTTCIALLEGEPRQSLNPSAALVVNPAHLGQSDDASTREWVRAKVREPFDLSAGPLLRACFVETANGNYGLIVVHHIIFDGASAVTLLSALAEAIQDIRSGCEPLDKPEPARFAEFARSEAAFLESAAAQQQLAYWRTQLAGELPATAMPLDRPRSAAPRIGATHLMELPAKLAEAAQRCARDLRINLSAFYLGVFSLLLSRYTGQEENVVVMPATSRRDPRFAACLGYFVNMIAIRSRVDGEECARDFLRSIQLTLADALDNGDYPFPALLQALNLSGASDGAFNTLFAFQNFTRDVEGESPFRLLPDIGQEGTHDLALEVYADAGNVSLHIGYAADLFDAAGIERFGAHYIRLIDELTRAPESPLRDLQLASSEERGRLLALAEGGPAIVDASRSIVDLFREQARRAPEAPALVFGRKALSYRKLDEVSTRVAAQLQASGVKPGDRIVSIMERGADMVVAFLGILKAGAVHVPLAPDLPRMRLRALIKDCGAMVALTQKAYLDRLPKQIKALTVKKLRRRNARPEPSLACPSDAPAYIIYTSGTTGTPKGVVVSHGAISHHCQVKRRIYGLTPDDRVLLFAPMSVDAALDQLLPGLSSGAAIIIRPEQLWTAGEFRRAVERLRLTAADLPPAYLQEVLASCAADADWDALASLRLIVSGGEALPAQTVRLLRDGPLRRVRLVNAYGPTETTVDSLIFAIDADTPEMAIGDDIAIGRPLPGESAYVFDSYGNLAPIGVPGELHIGGAGLALGYLNAPALTATKFVSHPFKPGEHLYKTGDLARWRADGVISFLGRRDGQAKLRGFRVETGEVETALRGVSGVRQAAVQVEAQDGHARLVAFVAGEAVGDLRKALAARLPEHMIPSAIVHVDSMPLTAGGKIDRAVLGRMHVDAARTSEPPRGEMEIKLAALLRNVLNREHVGRRDNFFDLGGNSLLAVKLVALIRKAFMQDLPIAALLETPDIAGLAKRLGGGSGAAQAATRQAHGDKPALFVVSPAAGPLCYRELTALMPGRPIHAPQMQSAKSIGQLAKGYVAELRRAQPRGPYHLAGWSAGGVIAFEVARQLVQAGESVARLALIDSYTPDALRRFERTAGFDRKMARLVAFASECGLAEQDARRILRTAGGERDAVLRALPDIKLADARRLFTNFERQAIAMDRFAPKPLALRHVALFRASDGPQDDHGWAALIEGLRANALPGNHFTMLRAPHAATLARKLGEFLDDDV